MPSIRDRFRRMPRPWRIIVSVLVVLYAAYLVAGNVFLNTPLFDMVTDRKPEKFQMDTGPAVTVIPGHVIAWDVRMRGHVRHTVYVLRAQRASGRIAIWPLFRRELRIPHIEASEVEAEVDRVAEEVPSPPQGDRGWLLRFDAIHSGSIRSGRFGELRVVGDGEGTVGFSKQIRGGPSELFPSQVSFRDARVSHGELAVIEQARITADFSYPRHYRAQAPGLAKLGITDARLRLSGRTLALRVETGGGSTRLDTVPAQATVDADVAMARGELRPGSRAVWRFPVLAGVDADNRGMLALQLDVARDIRVQARLPRDAQTGSELDADLRIGGRAIPWTAPEQLLPRLSGTVRGRWEFESLNWISDLFVRKAWFRLDGGGLVEGDLRLADGQLQPGSTLDIPHADARAEVVGVRISGAASAQGRIVAADGNTRQARLDVAMQRFEAAPHDAPREVFVRGQDLSLRMHGDADLQRLRDTLQARLRFRDAQVPDVAAYNRYLPQRNVRLLGGQAQLDGEMLLDASGEAASGSAALRGRGLRMAFAGLELEGDAELQARLRRADLKQRVFDLDGTTLALRGMHTADDDGGEPWWATLDIGRGRLDAGSPFQLDADARVAMRDASLVLAVFAKRSDYPRWILGLLDAGQLQAQGHMRWRRDGLQVDELTAANDRLSLRARLDIADAHRRGDLYLRWGVLGVGVELRDAQRQWHLKDARAWYDAQPPLSPPNAPR